MYVCSHIENMIFYKLATCISWAVFGGTTGGQHRQVSLYMDCMIREAIEIDLHLNNVKGRMASA
jgi:hypothetical protein